MSAMRLYNYIIAVLIMSGLTRTSRRSSSFSVTFAARLNQDIAAVPVGGVVDVVLLAQDAVRLVHAQLPTDAVRTVDAPVELSRCATVD